MASGQIRSTQQAVQVCLSYTSASMGWLPAVASMGSPTLNLPISKLDFELSESHLESCVSVGLVGNSYIRTKVRNRWIDILNVARWRAIYTYAIRMSLDIL